MSVRYGIDLVLEPSFTAKVYQTRQIVCGQYSSWAAEMQMLRMPLTPYFHCTDERLNMLGTQISDIAMETRAVQPYVLTRTGIVAEPTINGVVVEFEAPAQMQQLQRKAMDAVSTHSSTIDTAGDFQPRVALLEYGVFPPEILLDAVEFARGIAAGLGVAEAAAPWRLLLTRYTSDAAGEDWGNGRWSADLSWQQLASHPLYA